MLNVSCRCYSDDIVIDNLSQRKIDRHQKIFRGENR